MFKGEKCCGWQKFGPWTPCNFGGVQGAYYEISTCQSCGQLSMRMRTVKGHFDGSYKSYRSHVRVDADCEWNPNSKYPSPPRVSPDYRCCSAPDFHSVTTGDLGREPLEFTEMWVCRNCDRIVPGIIDSKPPTDAEIVGGEYIDFIEHFTPECHLWTPERRAEAYEKHEGRGHPISNDYETFLAANCYQCAHGQEEDCATGWWCKYITVGIECWIADAWRWGLPTTDLERFCWNHDEKARATGNHFEGALRHWPAKTERDIAITRRFYYPLEWMIENGIAWCTVRIPIMLEAEVAR